MTDARSTTPTAPVRAAGVRLDVLVISTDIAVSVNLKNAHDLDMHRGS